jgi:nitrogen fixation/metabolism regulation signal transduction histidine kinase
MTAEAQRVSHSPRTHPPRKLRNFLLDPKFQLKYTLMVVAVTVAVAAVLGYYAYDYSRGQTQMLAMAKSADAGDAATMAFIEAEAHKEDAKVLLAILGGIGALALALGITGIVVTHRLVGPAYRLKQLIREVSSGHIHVAGGLRKHDELQDVFEAFQSMVKNLRNAREEDIEELERALDKARSTGASPDVVAALEDVRARLQRSLS